VSVLNDNIVVFGGVQHNASSYDDVWVANLLETTPTITPSFTAIESLILLL
jgi:hypothetical protein